MPVKTPPELLAPAGSLRMAQAAFDFGADAIYCGQPRYSLRVRNNEFGDLDTLGSAVDLAHERGGRCYVVSNIYPRNAKLKTYLADMAPVVALKPDALIMADPGLMLMIRETWPEMPIHLSVQANTVNHAAVRFWQSVGVTRVILSRELSLDEIAEIRAACPDMELEVFVHGALCVAYSGQCYISHAQTGRSANRGDCSQACRLPFTLKDAQGRVVAFEKHLLSLKDNDQSANLLPLIAAGVRSFKIEGRYKDAGYVKNVTGHYRKLLDALFESHPELAPASSGTVTLKFAPHPDRTFHRGATDYFTHGRSADPAHIVAFDTPAFVGLPLGKVTRVGADHFDIATRETMSNGDGLSWLHKRAAHGTQANRAEKLDDGHWRVWPNDPVDKLPGLRPDLYVNRNRDQAWEQALTKDSAERRIAVDARIAETADGFALTLTDADGIAATATLALEKQPARQASAIEALREQIRRLGGTDFQLRDFAADWTQAWFLPNSAANALRRDAVAALVAARAAACVRPLRRPAIEPPVPYPEDSLTYLANVYNAAARRFYARHGVRLIAAAYEAHEEAGDVPLMITKHCLRHAFNLCPHQAKGVTGVQGQVRAEPMTLVQGDEELQLTFDCRACEMHVRGRMRPRILASPPPGSVRESVPE